MGVGAHHDHRYRCRPREPGPTTCAVPNRLSLGRYTRASHLVKDSGTIRVRSANNLGRRRQERGVTMTQRIVRGIPWTAVVMLAMTGPIAAQTPAPPGATPGATPAASTASAPPEGPNPDAHYPLGPDSLPQDGVPKGEVRGPFTLPEPGLSRHAAHLLGLRAGAVRPGQCPPSLMIFNDGQAFKNMEGDVRAPNVLDNLIYRREIPVMIGGVHQPRPHARAAGADAAGLGRPRHQPADRIQLARRQVRARHRRRADAGARQGLQHLEGSGDARHRRRELRRDRRVHRRVGAARRSSARC